MANLQFIQWVPWTTCRPRETRGALVTTEASKEAAASRNAKADKKTVADDVKAAASERFLKAKAAALVGAEKVKSGTSRGIEWVKEQYQKRASK
ncbi:hypothetical protein EJB05_05888, partial [Eragrostis curvula]